MLTLFSPITRFLSVVIVAISLIVFGIVSYRYFSKKNLEKGEYIAFCIAIFVCLLLVFLVIPGIMKRNYS